LNIIASLSCSPIIEYSVAAVLILLHFSLGKINHTILNVRGCGWRRRKDELYEHYALYGEERERAL